MICASDGLDAERADRCEDQEPLPERRFLLRRPLPPLRLSRDALLHGYIRREPWTGPVGAAHLGPSSGLADRETEEYRSGWVVETG